MKKIILTGILVFISSLCFAAKPQFVWVGGGMEFSDEAGPGYLAETMISLGEYNSIYLFSEPMVTVRGGKLGFDLGAGARTPVLSGEAIAGYNVFIDYTDREDHLRIGAGAEIYHPNFSGHMNVYLPVSDEKGNQEALPGIDLAVGVPIPNFSFVSLWPGLYFYNGNDEDDQKGISFMIQVKPIKVLTMCLGARNDSLSDGNDENEIFARIDVTFPMRRLGKDLFSFDKGTYPLDVRTSMDQRVVRERFITYEKKGRD